MSEDYGPLFILSATLSISIVVLTVFGETTQTAGGTFRSNHTSFVYDNDGIPFYNYSGLGLQRNALFVANEILFQYSDYNKTRDPMSREIAVNNADWLVSNAGVHGNYSTLDHAYPIARYGMEPPWRSALSQARAVEALGKAHDITGNQTYLDTAKSLLNAFFVEVKDGGVTYKTPNEGWWYEEYADNGPNTLHPRVLNGMISAVLSLHKYYQYTNDTAAKFLFDQGVLAIRNDLPKYDKGGYSDYNILNKPSPLKYHKMHVTLLGNMLKIVEDDVFQKYHDLWKNSRPSVNS